MCRAGLSAHGSPFTGNRRSRKNRGIAGKTRNQFTGVRLSNVQHPCDRPEKNPAAPIIGLGGDVAAGGVGAEPAPLFTETCTVEPVQDPGVNTPGEGDGGNSLNRVVVVPSFVVALTEGVGHPLGVVLGVDGRDRSCVSSLR